MEIKLKTYPLVPREQEEYNANYLASYQGKEALVIKYGLTEAEAMYRLVIEVGNVLKRYYKL